MAERKRDMKKQTEWSRNYNEKAYDRLYPFTPKGHKAEIEACAKSIGETLNEFINKAIDERTERLQRKREAEMPFVPPPGESCPEDCKKRCGVIYPGPDRTEQPWCSAYGIEITDYDEQTGKHRKCTECLQDSK